MPLSDRNIVITPNRGATSEPTITFTGANTSTSATIVLRVLNSGSVGFLSIEGTSGQLFSISDSLSGSIFSVNDISGIPSIEVFDTGEIRMAQYNGFVDILSQTSATSTNSGALQVVGGVGIGGSLYVGGTIFGSISGTTGSASQINTVERNTNASHFITFVDSNNTSTLAESVYTTSTLVINPSTGNVGLGVATPSTRLDVSGGLRVTGITTVTNTTAASSTITGALQVAGGVGIGGNLYVGGEIVAQQLTISLTTVSTTLVTTDDIIRTVNTSNATSTTTGALQVSGGAGIGRDLWVGGEIYKNGVIFTGVQGVQGITGNQGTQGITGSQGIQGITGAQGIQGIQGTNANVQGIQGTQGITGSQGVQGITGNQGIQGIQGIQGTNANVQGIQGTQGITGSQGVQGITGNQGIQGITGAQGVQGIQGISGSQGIQGTAPTTVQTNTGATHFITFVGNNNTSSTAESFYTTSSLTVNPGTGNVGIGSNPGAVSPLTVSRTFNTTTAAESFSTVITSNYDVADTGFKQALRLNSRGRHTSGTLGSLFNSLALLAVSGAGGTTNNAYNYWSRMDVSSGATVTNAFNIYIDESSGTGGPANQFGIYINELTKGTNSDYAIYTVGTTTNYFGGNVGIGITIPSTKLDISGGLRVTGITTVTNTTTATSTTTGAFTVAGGAGIGQDLWVGGEIYKNGVIFTGVQGIQGRQGVQGITGNQGVQGITGNQGVQGIQGIQGIQGTNANVQGIQGTQGITGSQGVQGITGNQGIQGRQGVQGITGNQGVQGITGNQGVQGIQGIQGTNANVQGIQGIQGITGAQGIQGTQGISPATLASNTNATHFITFVPDNNATTTPENFYTTSSFTINPNTRSLTIDSVTIPIGIFNNMSQVHSARTSFDASAPSYNFGFRYVQGSTNGPGTAGTQYYSWYIGLGSEYPATGAGSYGAMFAIDRNVTTPYLSIRYNENNVFTTWRKVAAGYADTAGSATTAGSVDFNNLTNKTGGSGTYTTSGDFRAPIFYDSNDTNYYVDPASTSRQNIIRNTKIHDDGNTFVMRYGSNSGSTRHINLADTNADPSQVVATGGGTGISWGERTDNTPYYIIHLVRENYGGDYTKLVLAWHTGIRIGAASSYGGTRFFNNSPFTGTEIFSVGKSDNHVRVENNLYTSIMYDINDTNYYSDPSSLTRINNFSAVGYALITTGSLGVGDASTRGLIFDGNYSNGTYRHRFRKQDDGAGLPLYLDYTHGTANSYAAIARFGGGGTYRELDIYGNQGITGSLFLSTGNATGGGLILADDGDIVDLNDGYCAMRFSNGVRVHSGNRSGGAVITLANSGNIIASKLALGGESSIPQGMLWGNGDIWLTGGTRKVGFSTDSTTDSVPNVTLEGNVNDLIVYNWSGSSYNENFRVLGTGRYSQAQGSMRAPIFYDLENTDYYVDPNNESRIYRLRVGPYAGSVSSGNVTGLEIMNGGGTGDSNVAAISFHCQNTYGMHLHLRSDGYFGAGGWSASSWRWYCDMVNANFTVVGSIRTPIYYDENNTGYYIDPNSTSNLIGLTVANTITGYVSGAKFSNDSEDKDNITTRTESGFWQTSSGTTAEGWPLNDGGWQHMLACTHSNDSNYYSMQIGGSFYDNSFYGRKTNGSGSTAWIKFLTSGTTGDSVQFGSFGVGTAASGTTGEIRATNNITAYYSDERLKTKLGNIQNALEKVCRLNGFYHEANELAQSLGYKKIKEVGVSAQEVQEVLPEVVAPAPIDEKYLTVRYERLVPLLIEAIKEQQKEVDSLKQQINNILEKISNN